MIEKLLVLFFLIILSFQDIKRKSVSLILLIAMYIAGSVFCVFRFKSEAGIYDYQELILALIVVLILTVFSAFFKMIGMGDVLVVGLILMFFGGYHAICIFLVALFLASVFSSALLIAGKIKPKEKIPFIPFMFIAFTGVIFCI